MIRKWIVPSVPFIALLVGGLAYGYTTLSEPTAKAGEAAAYVCPVTGEELPCPNCCPLNR